MENTQKKSKMSKCSVVFYAAAVIVAIIGIALLVDNVVMYKKTVSQYVAQGYKAATVSAQLVPSQLLPAIFNAIGVYGGIAFVLAGVGTINDKISKHLASNEEVHEDAKLDEGNKETVSNE